MPWNKGKKMSVDFVEKCRSRQLGKTHSTETRMKMAKSQKGKKHNLTYESRNKIGSAHRGEKSHWWQGGKTIERQRIYNSLEYREWRRKVFERDNFTCQKCGQIGGHLQADHIKPFSIFPLLRFVLSNGRTLCLSCHRETDTFGSKIRNYPTPSYPQVVPYPTE